MILLKACPRCGGDVDMTYHDDVYCVQCGCRPEVAYPGPCLALTDSERVRQTGSRARAEVLSAPMTSRMMGGSRLGEPPVCRRCGSEEVIRLDKLRPQDNTCYRCHLCGYIFSPGIARRRVGG